MITFEINFARGGSVTQDHHSKVQETVMEICKLELQSFGTARDRAHPPPLNSVQNGQNVVVIIIIIINK